MMPGYEECTEFDDVLKDKHDDWVQCPNCKGWDQRWLVEGAECCIQKAKDEAEAAYEEECYGPGA